ncbi:MAG: transcription elongation factor GreAB, partial [Clostridiales bacterium]|nr:transcription elongation factor GreAB [Clostridiales bacterium]
SEMHKEKGTLDKTVKKLEDELERAIVTEPQQIPADVVTMNSRSLLHLNDEDIEVSLVYPEDADIAQMKVSIFSPIGTAILGYKEGSVVEWEVPSGTSKIHIKKVLYQPEAAGDYEL